MPEQNLLELVDGGQFRELFIDHLGWNNPDRPPIAFDHDGTTLKLEQVAGYRGLRVWLCKSVPDRKTQRLVDRAVGVENLERLIIFAGNDRQEWRWPRRGQTGGVNAKLLLHRHVVGADDHHLDEQLHAIEIDLDSEPSLVEILGRMRQAFDVEAETASVKAARLMGTLYAELEQSDVDPEDATLLLARLLFLLFGDDSGMWKNDLFHSYLEESSSAETLHDDLMDLFAVLDIWEGERNTDLPDQLLEFRYINGGLFTGDLTLGPLTEAFYAALLSACEFDWQVISPAIFGSMFQTVKDKEARREGGEHYTTEENILRTIGPLFLDEFHERLRDAWDDKRQLTRLHNDLEKLRLLDPACGCGNFLVVAYRELRALELELLKRRRDLDSADGRSAGRNLTQMSIDVSEDVKVTLDHFFGIEIEEWPARIAETAMLLVDHLANQRMEEDFGLAPDRLPIRIAPSIVHKNALDCSWEEVVEPSEDVVIVGNPPFIGQYTKTRQQTADTKRIWGERYDGYLDYVTCWYAKTIDYFGDLNGRWAFVSTNSIYQGEAVKSLFSPILEGGWRCRFAHRSLRWVTEATDGAAVHVSIVGFDKSRSPKPVLWSYGIGGAGEQLRQDCSVINPYLVPDGEVVLVEPTSSPVSADLLPVDYGNKPTDGGNFTVKLDALESVRSDPVASKYLRRFVGSKELISGKERWCLWLASATEEEIRSSEILRERVRGVREMRLASTKAATRRKAETPALFDENRHYGTRYLAIPRHVSEARDYFTAVPFGPEVICGDANFMARDTSGFVLGVVSSSMFISWMRAIGGRIKSDLRFSNTFVYNSFPLPKLSRSDRQAVISAATAISDARDAHIGTSIEDLYEPGDMPEDLLRAHRELDRVIDGVFGTPEIGSLDERQRHLFRLYKERLKKLSRSN